MYGIKNVYKFVLENAQVKYDTAYKYIYSLVSLVQS